MKGDVWLADDEVEAHMRHADDVCKKCTLTMYEPRCSSMHRAQCEVL